MSMLLTKVTEAFSSSFGYEASHFFRAPGRVNLIGEHTDYNDGFVLPCAIDYQTLVASAKRNDSKVRVVSVDYNFEIDEFDLNEEIEFQQDKMWSNYVRGVVKFLIARGYPLQGIDIAVSGNVPQSTGLSSSASFEVVIGQTFKTLCSLSISQAEIALIGQQAENEFIGCNCGIMDQLISAEGKESHALLIDCRSLETQAIPIPKNLSVVIINSNKQRGLLVDSEYNTRREQCEQASLGLGVKALRDASMELLNMHSSTLDSTVVKRARHIISENNRTQEAALALQSGDMRKMSQLMTESHVSMRDDFEITVKEIDILVDIVKDVIGEEGGVRMTGGGFGGCVVALVPPALVDKVKEAVVNQYETMTGLKEDIFVCQVKNGAGIVEVKQSEVLSCRSLDPI